VSDPLPHDQLMRELDRLWRDARRAKLAEAGIEIRRPRHGWPEAPARPATVEVWARALVDVAAIHEGGLEHVDVSYLMALTDRYRRDAQTPDEVLPLLELAREDLEDALADALDEQRRRGEIGHGSGSV
jgi:hypothetical protein